MRGAWIEMLDLNNGFQPFVSLPVRGAWIEICRVHFIMDIWTSLPVRGAWIEITVGKNNYFNIKGRSL